MKILYDHLGFMEKFGGVSKYYSEVIPRLDSDIDYKIALKFSSNENINNLINIKTIPFITKDFPHKDRLYSELNKPFSLYNIKHENYDIYHNTHVDPYGFHKVPKNKLKVMTIHDLNLYKIPGLVSDSFSLKVWQKESSKLVDGIITISMNTKKDIIEYFNIDESKIKVIYHGKPDINPLLISEDKLIQDPYFLYVGARSAFKNFNNLLKAFSIFVQTHQDIKLVCTGKTFTQDEKSLIDNLKLSNHIIQKSVKMEELYNLYKYAIAYFYPSLYEGFGLPILEAQTCGCPVSCSNTSCFPEIAADSALYFDPLSIDSILHCMSVLSSSDNSLLIKKGFLNIKRFDWNKSAKEHSDFYRGL